MENAFDHVFASCWPANEEICGEMDFEWFCVDSAGSLGICTTAGEGLVPGIGITIGAERFYRILDVIAGRRPAGAVPVFLAPGKIDEWRTLASHGLYAFDYQEYPPATKKGYHLIFRPESPTHLEELPEDLQLWVSVANVTFAEIDFLPFSKVRH